MLIVFVVVYPLSLGPAMKVANRHPPARAVVEAVYSPPLFLMARSRPADRLFEWYIRKVWGE